MSKKPKIFVFEGADGVGKTTLMHTLAQRFECEKNVYFYDTQHLPKPAKQIREYAIENAKSHHHSAQLLLFFSSFVELINEIERINDSVTQPLFLVDRMDLSTYAYQKTFLTLDQTNENDYADIKEFDDLFVNMCKYIRSRVEPVYFYIHTNDDLVNILEKLTKSKNKNALDSQSEKFYKEVTVNYNVVITKIKTGEFDLSDVEKGPIYSLDNSTERAFEQTLEMLYKIVKTEQVRL